MSPFPTRIFISPTSVTAIFKSFSLQLFFRETLNDKSATAQKMKKSLMESFMFCAVRRKENPRDHFPQ